MKIGKIFLKNLRIFISLAVILSLFLSGIAQKCEATDVKEGPTGESILFDLLVLRPAGITACALGILASILSIPFSLGTQDTEYIGKKLIHEPFEYTFLRPLGQIEPIIDK